MTQHQKDVVVAICTFRRDELADTLGSVAGQMLPRGTSASILVVDNDETPSAAPRVEDFAAVSRLPVAYAHCPARNISVARNGALDRAKSRFLAFIDDDEVAEPGWLAALLETQHDTAADAVFGPVRAEYARTAPAWIRQADLHSTKPVFVGGHIRTGYTCNALLDLSAPAFGGMRFDVTLGRSGGEDTDFFSRAFANGARFAEAPAAVVKEPVVEARASLEWLARRRFRSGQTHGRILGRDVNALLRGVEASLAALKVLYCAGSALLVMPNPGRRNAAALRGALHAGTIAGLLGSRPLTLYGGDRREADL